MILTGPTKELDMKAYQENVQYDMYGSTNVIREFYIRENMYIPYYTVKTLIRFREFTKLFI